MDAGENNRRAKRKDFYCDIKVRFFGEDDYATLASKDISASGLRVITARLVKAGDSLEIKMCVNGRDIQCRGKVTWVLLLRPSLGTINSFDVGIEFCGMNSADRDFLEQLTAQ